MEPHGIPFIGVGVVEVENDRAQLQLLLEQGLCAKILGKGIANVKQTGWKATMPVHPDGHKQALKITS